MNALNTEAFELEALLRSPRYLPSREDVRRVCKTFTEIRDGNYAHASIEQREFNARLAKNAGFEVLTKEFISALGEYLVSREGNRILELGAGGGRLAYFLSKELEAQAPGRFEYHAVDNGEWDIPDPYGIVEKLRVEEALTQYDADLVLVSWMPPQTDWTKAIRQTQSVREYILIGEDGSTGKEWETWGEWQQNSPRRVKRHVAPYLREGFTKHLMRTLSNLQINRHNEMNGEIWNRMHSATYSFRRR